MEITLRSIRSNLDLNPFPGFYRHLTLPAKEDVQIYNLDWGRKCRRSLHAEPKKNNRLIFDESRFLDSKSLDLGSSIHFSIISMFLVTRRAGWAHSNSKSNMVFGKSSK